MKITDKFAFSERWLQNFQEPAAERDNMTSKQKITWENSGQQRDVSDNLEYL